MPSGNLFDVTFTPQRAGRLVVTAIFDAEGVASDFNSNVGAKVFFTQSGVTTYGEFMPSPLERQRHIAQAIFTVAGGAPVTCGLWGQVIGASAGYWRNIVVNATLLKK